jgi:hypothetical protein
LRFNFPPFFPREDRKPYTLFSQPAGDV